MQGLCEISVPLALLMTLLLPEQVVLCCCCRPGTTGWDCLSRGLCHCWWESTTTWAVWSSWP